MYSSVLELLIGLPLARKLSVIAKQVNITVLFVHSLKMPIIWHIFIGYAYSSQIIFNSQVFTDYMERAKPTTVQLELFLHF